MRLSAPNAGKTRAEPTIALINIVFLMLIFFLIAGTLAPPIDRDVTLVSTSGLEGREPPDAMVIHADGKATLRGEPVDPSTVIVPAGGESPVSIRIVPDRDLPAVQLIEIADELRRRGVNKVFIVTEKGLE